MKITVGNVTEKWDDDSSFVPEENKIRYKDALTKPCHNERFILKAFYPHGRVIRKRIQFMVTCIEETNEGFEVQMNRLHLKHLIERCKQCTLELCRIFREKQSGEEVPVRIRYSHKSYDSLLEIRKMFIAECVSRVSWTVKGNYRW